MIVFYLGHFQQIHFKQLTKQFYACQLFMITRTLSLPSYKKHCNIIKRFLFFKQFDEIEQEFLIMLVENLLCPTVAQRAKTDFHKSYYKKTIVPTRWNAFKNN